MKDAASAWAACCVMLLIVVQITKSHPSQKNHPLRDGISQNNRSCVFHIGENHYDLTPFRNTVVSGPKDMGGKLDVSLCGDLPVSCLDALTGNKINGSVFDYFGTFPDFHCWDVLAHWDSGNYSAQALSGTNESGIEFVHTRKGDAHLSCKELVVSTRCICDTAAPSHPSLAKLAGYQDDCSWFITIRSSSPAVCKPARVKRGDIINLYVDPINGDDSNSGALENPLKTLAGAQQKRRTYESPATVYLFPGIHNVPLEGLLLSSEDSNTSWVKYGEASSAVISGGMTIPSSCWKRSTTVPNVFECVNVSTSLQFKAINMDGVRLIPARYPNFEPSNPYAGGWMFVKTSHFLGGNKFSIGIDASVVPDYMKKNGFAANALVFPIHSWINIDQGTIVYSPNQTDPTMIQFIYQCPDQGQCSATSNNEAVVPGTRFYIYGTIDALDAPGEWFYDPTSRVLSIYSDHPGSVTLPYVYNLVHTRSASNIVFSGLTFTDTDYISQGFQEDFNQKPWPPAMPCDSAVAISGGSNITFDSCDFYSLGGGGILATNSSTAITVMHSSFRHLGQTGVMFIGNSTTQVKGALVSNNTFDHLGEILASAAGVIASTVSDATIRFNLISNASRWGIAVRSNGPAMSMNNLIELNKISNVGLRTRDLGGISLIGSGYTGSVIRNNCVHNVVGIDTDSKGNILSPFFNWGIYLDNWSSGFLVEGNVVTTNVNGGIFFHGGKDNIVIGNVLHNSSQANAIREFFAQVLVGKMQGDELPANNTFERNIVYYTNATNALVRVSGTTQPFNKSFLRNSNNLYFNPNLNISSPQAPQQLTPEGSWHEWQAFGEDIGSVVDMDPMFRDVNNGDFRLRPGSPASSKILFPVIPDYIAQCP